METVSSVEEIDSQAYWDPVFGELSANIVEECLRSNEKLIIKLNHYQQHIGATRRNVLLLSIVAIVFLIMLLYSLIAYQDQTVDDLETTCEVFLFPTVLLLGYYHHARSLEKPLVNLLIAKEYGWLYNPNHLKEQFQGVEDYLKFFVKDYNRQEPNDQKDIIYSAFNQFWGSFNGAPFWSARFSYSTNGDTKTLYAFHLKRKAAYNFKLESQNLSNKIWPHMHQDLSTESNDFNKLFHIEFRGDRGLVGADILQVLSPDAQEKLIEFRKGVGSFQLLFKDDVMFVIFQKELKPRYTNFLKEVALDPRDVEIIAKRMANIISLADTILPCIV